MRLKIAAIALTIAYALGGCAARPFAAFEDPRPEGRLSLSERSRCEVRAFIDQRDSCDHFRGEPWPEGDSPYDLERRRELAAAMKTACGGSDAHLRALRAKYRDDAIVVAALAAYEDDIEP
jgi:hypothetical protein